MKTSLCVGRTRPLSPTWAWLTSARLAGWRLRTGTTTPRYSAVQCTVQYSYPQDGDNYLDICLDLGPPDEASLVLGAGSLHLEVLCDPGLELSLLYPPKGRPHGCSYQNVEMTASNINSDKLLMYWDASLV